MRKVKKENLIALGALTVFLATCILSSCDGRFAPFVVLVWLIIVIKINKLAKL